MRREIDTADAILANLNSGNALTSPYVVSAVYYHDGFLARFPEDRADADPSRRVIAHVVRALTPESKSRFIQVLHDLWEEKPPREQAGQFVPPVRFAPLRAKRSRRQHRSVSVAAGSLVESGSLIGTVGHTGINASRNGHGRHLHYEVNAFEDGKMRPFSYDELRTLLLTSGSETGCCNRRSTPAARAFP